MHIEALVLMQKLHDDDDDDDDDSDDHESDDHGGDDSSSRYMAELIRFELLTKSFRAVNIR